MTDSIQLFALKKLTLELEGITPANGYQFDMSDRVFRGRLVYGDDDPIPMLSIVEHLQPDGNISVAGFLNSERAETWILLVQGWVENKPKNPTDDAYLLKAAVEKRLSDLIATDQSTGNPLYPNRYLLGMKKTIINITIGPGLVSGPRAEVSAKAFFYLPVGISLAMSITNPYVPGVEVPFFSNENTVFTPTVTMV